MKTGEFIYRIYKVNLNNFIHVMARIIFYLIPGSFRFRVLRGSNKGFLWIKGSGLNSFWLGIYEIPKQELLANYAKKGMVAYDIGAQAGFYTLLFSRLVGDSGRVFSFEPDPQHLFYLRNHIRINKIRNAVILPVAIADANRLNFFNDGLSLEMRGFLAQEPSPLLVQVYSLDSLVFNKIIPSPDIIKIDAEGSEKLVLLGAKQIIKEYKPVIQVALDMPETREFIFEFLKEFKYDLQFLDKEKTELFGTYKNL